MSATDAAAHYVGLAIEVLGNVVVVHADGTTTSLKPYTFLLAGDVVVARSPNALTEIRLANGEDHVVEGPDGRFAAPSSLGRSFLSRATRLFIRALLVDDDWRLIDLGTQGGEPLQLKPPGTATPQKIVAGQRRLFLGWFGGLPPFVLTFATDRGIFLEMSVDERTSLVDVLVPSTLAKLRIHDSQRESIDVWFEGVEHERMPMVPGDLMDGQLPPATGAALRAAWIVEKGGPTWTIEALSQLAPFIDRKASAAQIFRQILSGRPLTRRY